MSGYVSRGAGSRFAGKKISIYISLAVFFLTLVFPKQGNFVLANFSAAQSNKAGLTAASAILIQVVQPVVKTKIQVSQIGVQTVAAANCQAVFGAPSDIVQDAGLVNLNQPANCFSLQDSLNFNYSSVHLSVVSPKAPAVKVAVVIPQSKISAPDFLPATGGQSAPVLPLIFFTVGLLLALWEKKFTFKKLAQKARALKLTLNLHQLQVLRC